MSFGIETIKLFNKVVVLPENKPGNRVDDRLIAALNLEAAAFGYTLSPNLMFTLSARPLDEFYAIRTKLIADLVELSGAGSRHTRLFKDFPYAVPDQYEYLWIRIVGFIANEFDIPLGGKSLTALSCGHVIDSNLFDIASFGACPICQHQVPELSSPDNAVYPYAAVTPLKVLDDFSFYDLVAVVSGMMNRQSSLSKDEKTFITNALSEKISMPMPEKVYRENLPFLYTVFGLEVAPALAGATDILRIAAYLSDPEADLSLTKPTKFKLKTSDKKKLLALLNGVSNLSEDMMRHREMWLRFGEIANPGSAKNRTKYGKVAEAFDDIRNNSGDIQTFNRKMEKNLREKVVNTEFIRMMSTRPGEFIRKLDFMLRTGEPRIVLGGLRNVLPNASEESLLVIRKYLASRNNVTKRMFFPKGQANRVQIMDDNRSSIGDDVLAKVIERIDAELINRYAKLDAMNRVYIDPELKNILLPYNRRGDSSTMDASAISKGSRVSFNGDVIRLFVHWTNSEPSDRTDVDLSMVLLDRDFGNVGHIAFTNLADSGCVHSGDIQNAPQGASEFIDFEVETLRNCGVRYVAASVNNYTGQTFDKFPCYAGFMERDALKSGKVYEPQSVKTKFDINSSNTTHTPLIFDLVERKVIFADISGGNSRFGAVSNQAEKFKALTEGVMSLPDRKPTVHDLLSLHAMARGTIVDDINDADTIYRLEDAAKVIADGVA